MCRTSNYNVHHAYEQSQIEFEVLREFGSNSEDVHWFVNTIQTVVNIVCLQRNVAWLTYFYVLIQPP